MKSEHVSRRTTLRQNSDDNKEAPRSNETLESTLVTVNVSLELKIETANNEVERNSRKAEGRKEIEQFTIENLTLQGFDSTQAKMKLMETMT